MIMCRGTGGVSPGHESNSWWEWVVQAKSVEKLWTTWKLAKLPEFWKITISFLFIIFQNFVNFANFYVVHDFSTEIACPTHSHQLLFHDQVIPQLSGVLKKWVLYCIFKNWFVGGGGGSFCVNILLGCTQVHFPPIPSSSSIWNKFLKFSMSLCTWF